MVMESSQVLQGERLRLVLRVSCLRASPATVQLGADSEAQLANFVSLSQDSVTLDLRDAAQRSVPAGSTCYVSFCYGCSVHVFASAVLDRATTQIVLAMPKQIVMERRLSLRKLVTSDSELQVMVTTGGGRVVPAVPRDLSPTGMFLESLLDEYAELVVGTCVTVELRLAENEISVAGVVQRRDGNGYGIAFPEVASEREAELPNRLHELYITLVQHQQIATATATGQHPLDPAPAMPVV
jgi:hypothetical protein